MRISLNNDNTERSTSDSERFKNYKDHKSYLQAEGFKLTKKREAILREIVNLKGHFEAEDFIVHLREIGLNISRATIYRTLPRMVKCGILREVRDLNKNFRYEYLAENLHHDHLVCLSCGNILDFNDSTVEKIQIRICEEKKFTPRAHRMEIVGYCKECCSFR